MGRPRFAAGFLRLFAATAATGLGDGCRIAALAVLATTLTDSPVLIALVTVAARVPWIVIGPFAGAFADAVEPWRAMRLCLVLRAAVVAAFAVLVLTGGAGIWVLIAVSFVISSIDTLADNLAQAVVPQVAGGAGLEAANSRIMGAQAITTDFVGTPFGPLLLAVAAALPFGADALLTVLAAVLIWTVRAPARASLDRPALTVRGLAVGAGEGMRALWRSGTLRTVALAACLVNCANLTVLSIAVLYTVHVLHVSAALYGVLLLVIGIGGLAGLAVTSWCVARLGRTGTLLLSTALCPGAFVIGGLTSNAVVAAAALSLVGFTTSVMTVVTLSLRQDTIPESHFGRVNAAYRLVVNGVSPAGGLLGGVVAGLAGLRAPFFVSAGFAAVATAAVAWLVVSGRSSAGAAQSGSTR
ncbi:MFS transporter [Lentzea sp. NPDC060358]|uniref:MFS transporter n=1 Tax=Lentzea sp. NPDC060358 TaxID=3347103 RepID=UPI003661651F